MDTHGVGEQSPRFIVRRACVCAQRGHLCLDIRPKAIGKSLGPGQQPEGCRARLLGDAVRVA